MLILAFLSVGLFNCFRPLKIIQMTQSDEIKSSLESYDKWQSVSTVALSAQHTANEENTYKHTKHKQMKKCLHQTDNTRNHQFHDKGGARNSQLTMKTDSRGR